MGHRRLAREIAVHALYEIAQSDAEASRALRSNLERRDAGDTTREYAARLLREIEAHRPDVTQRISGTLENWTLERVALVERCVLEVGTVEILYFPDVPPSVVIDEAVDIARKFSSEESGAFVNGVLDRIARDAAPEGHAAGADSAEAES
ncbi:MAG: transcription antitermination factor NusB [Candidatus Krumholzibacteriia bacterium]